MSRYVHLQTCPLCAAAYEGLALAEDDSPQAVQALPQSPDVAFAEALVAPFPNAAHVDAAHIDVAPADAALATPARRPHAWLSRSMAAAATLLLIAAAWLLWPDSSTPVLPSAATTDVFADVIEPFARRQRTADTVVHDVYFKAAEAYELGQYTRAAVAYHEALDTKNEIFHDTRGYYELGITQWRLQQLDSAANYLTRARMGEASYFEDASWALAKVYVQQHELSKAEIVLHDLIELPRSAYTQRAHDLLKRLSEPPTHE